MFPVDALTRNYTPLRTGAMSGRKWFSLFPSETHATHRANQWRRLR